MLGEAGGESQFGSFAYIDKTADFRLRAAVDVMRGGGKGAFRVLVPETDGYVGGGFRKWLRFEHLVKRVENSARLLCIHSIRMADVRLWMAEGVMWGKKSL